MGSQHQRSNSYGVFAECFLMLSMLTIWMIYWFCLPVMFYLIGLVLLPNSDKTKKDQWIWALSPPTLLFMLFLFLWGFAFLT